MKSIKTDIKEFTPEERKRSIERQKINESKCVSCRNYVKPENNWCEFCINEE